MLAGEGLCLGGQLRRELLELIEGGTDTDEGEVLLHDEQS